VTKDRAKAVELFQAAADQGNTMAMSNLAECYRGGIGVEKDVVKAKELAYKAAAAPDALPTSSAMASLHASSRKSKLERLQAVVDHPDFSTGINMTPEMQAEVKRELAQLKRHRATCGNANCGKVEKKMSQFGECSACRGKTQVRYCSSACQQADRKRHRALCKRVIAEHSDDVPLCLQPGADDNGGSAPDAAGDDELPDSLSSLHL
jgi:hypothetical protein